MLARLGVEAILKQSETCDGLAANNVRIDDFGYILQLDVSIPDAFGVDDDIRAVLALIEASRLVGSDSGVEPPSGQLLLETELKIGQPIGIAAAPRVFGRPPISADENMMFETHVLNWSVHQELSGGQVGHIRKIVPRAVQPAAKSRQFRTRRNCIPSLMR